MEVGGGEQAADRKDEAIIPWKKPPEDIKERSARGNQGQTSGIARKILERDCMWNCRGIGYRDDRRNRFEDLEQEVGQRTRQGISLERLTGGPRWTLRSPNSADILKNRRHDSGKE